MSVKVYLAGPISGLDYNGATSWRDYAIKELAKGGIKGLSPMRGKEYLSHLENISATCVAEGALSVLSAPRGIMTRDFMDCTKANAVLVNFEDAQTVSIGTVMEIAWAYAARVPVVCVMPKFVHVEGMGNFTNPHEHATIHEAIGYRVETLDEGIQIVRAVLEAYV